MREDMHRVVINTPRFGHGIKNEVFRSDRKKTKRLVKDGRYEDVFSREKTGRLRELSDNLKPLERFLWSRAGRPWDKVYSEICAGLPGNSVHMTHIRGHIDGFVMKPHEYVFDGGKLCSIRYFSLNHSDKPREVTRDTLYVDKHGILRQYRTSFRRYRRKQNAPHKIVWLRERPEKSYDIGAVFKLYLRDGLVYRIDHYDDKLVDRLSKLKRQLEEDIRQGVKKVIDTRKAQIADMELAIERTDYSKIDYRRFYDRLGNGAAYFCEDAPGFNRRIELSPVLREYFGVPKPCEIKFGKQKSWTEKK